MPRGKGKREAGQWTTGQLIDLTREAKRREGEKGEEEEEMEGKRERSMGVRGSHRSEGETFT